MVVYSRGSRRAFNRFARYLHGFDFSTLADRLADKAKEESLDVARALLLHLPTQKDVRFSQPVDEN
jgi:hypothetical protein